MLLLANQFGYRSLSEVSPRNNERPLPFEPVWGIFLSLCRNELGFHQNVMLFFDAYQPVEHDINLIVHHLHDEKFHALFNNGISKGL